MQLANDLKRALGKRRAGPWKANNYAMGIKTGRIRLKNLFYLAKEGNCSLVYLTSGGCYEAANNLTPKEAVIKSAMHKGYDKHDFARMLGYQNFSYLARLLDNGTLPVKILMKIAETLDMEVWELLCDGEYTYIDPLELKPTEWDQLVELNLMGWLDAKPRDTYEKDGGPGI